MATFYIQLQDKLLQISGELTAENIFKALGYVPVDSSTMNNYATKDEVSDLVDMSMVEELSQRVDNITFDSLKDNPFLQDGSGELNIVDEAGNIIAKIDANGIHSVDFIAGNHKLTDKIDSSALNGYAKESWVTAEITKAATEGKVDLTGYATEEWVENKNYLTEHQDISHLANKDEIPTKVSDLENDSNYLTEHQDISHLATKQEVSDIDFYNINNNPIVNNGDGKLLFVDENGYIGLQLEEDGLYVKDVIADGHTLSQKADKSDIPSLDGYATESYVNTNLQNYATKDEVSDLVDMSVVTELQGKVGTLVGEDTDKSVRDIAVDVLTETLVSETATEAYDTLAEMSDWIKSHPEDAAAMNTAIQKNATDITNLDASYKEADTKVLTDAQEYTDNINFYTIKDNPIVDNNDGNLTFVDETGNIGLQFSNNAILVNDVITPEHTLSSKVDKSFVEDNYYNKSTVDKKITEAVTGGQVSLDGFATEQWVNEQGFLKEHQDISHLAEKSELPTKTSDLTNDSGFITINEVPEVTVPTKVSELENDSKFITIDEVPEVTVPTKTSDLTNDSGYITDTHLDDSIMWVKAEGESGVRLKGTNGTATGNLAISAGDDKTASDGTSFTSEASGDHAVVFGYGNTCAGRTTLAQGLYNTVNGKDSVAFGQRNLVEGDQAFAVGQQNEVTSRLGVAIGYKNKATNTDSIAIGYQNNSGGSGSVALGDTCESNGTSSTAMGYKTKATGAYSSTFGENTQATNEGEVAMGKYNKSTTSTEVSEQTAFSFGIGTSDTNRVNAFEIKKNGDVYIGDKLLSDEYVTETELNDKGFLTEHQEISHLASRIWVESQGYAHQEDLLEISFNDIQDSPISIDDSGMINFVDESGNVGFQINEEGLRVTDVIAGEHKLSEKANASDIPSLDGYAKTEDIPSVDGLVKSEDLPNFNEFAKTEDIPSLDGYAKTSDIPSLDDYASKEWVNNRNYATEYDLKTIDYSSINNIPTLEDETGELNIADESGNIGMKVASEAVYAKDFVSGEHKLSEKVDKTYVDGLVGDINSILESIINS